MPKVQAELLRWARTLKAICGQMIKFITVCSGMPGELIPPGRIGYKIAGIFFAKETNRAIIRDPLLRREYVHTQQWYHYGEQTGYWFSFAILYALAGENACTNKYEQQAGLAEGNYPCP
ncbi:hypothetical protein [Streptosporangium sp. NPDC000509]|uniref:hypothetical protein n=1 Tax=Streptosporangium sp. NPDC000509 TaxID=3366186 RepID=UPI00369FE9E6